MLKFSPVMKETIFQYKGTRSDTSKNSEKFIFTPNYKFFASKMPNRSSSYDFPYSSAGAEVLNLPRRAQASLIFLSYLYQLLNSKFSPQLDTRFQIVEGLTKCRLNKPVNWSYSAICSRLFCKIFFSNADAIFISSTDSSTGFER